MKLTLNKLMTFSLAKDLQDYLLKPKNQEKLFDYLTTTHQIQMANRVILEIPSYPDSLNFIVRNQAVLAIGATLAIEGRNLTEDDIYDALKKAKQKKGLRQIEREIANADKVYNEFILGNFKTAKRDFKYKEMIIKEIHKIMTDGLNYPGNVPGQYRKLTTEVMFGYPPVPSLCRNEGEVQAAMAGLVNWLNRKDQGQITPHPIVKAIIAHYYITEIHPFTDGNGRTARALESLILYANGVNRYCFWSLANFWSINRNTYIKYLREVRETCNAWNLLICGMKGYLEELNRTKEKVLKKIKQLMLMDYAKWLIATKRNSKISLNNKRTIILLEWLEQIGSIEIDKFLRSPELEIFYRGRTIHTRRRDLQKMLAVGLIREFEEEKTKRIEPNYKLLEELRYRI